MSATTEHHASLPAHITPEYLRPPVQLRDLQKKAMFASLVGVTLLVIFAVIGLGGDAQAKTDFWRAYLHGFMMCFGLTLGSLALLMLQHVTGGKWGLVLRRLLEAGTRNLWLVALMFLPLIAGLAYLYPWAQSADAIKQMSVHAQHAIHERHAYLNQNAWLVRAAIYFIGWGILAYFFNKWSPRLDVPAANIVEYERQRIAFMRLAGGGLLFYAITVSLAAIDWVMSLDAVFYSTIWGMLYMAGQALLTMSFMLIVLVTLAKYEPLKTILRKTELHDNGKLLLAFVMLYTYLSFSQFIIIWSGNIVEEAPWYLSRVGGGWKPVIVLLAIFHFAVPFLLLLNRNLKKHPVRLRNVAILLVLARIAEQFWIIAPHFKAYDPLAGGRFHLTGYDTIPFAMVAVWCFFYFRELDKKPLIPAHHHLVPEILEPAHGAH